MEKQRQTKLILAEINSVIEMLDCGMPKHQVFNRLRRKGFSQLMARVCIEQAEKK